MFTKNFGLFLFLMTRAVLYRSKIVASAYFYIEHMFLFVNKHAKKRAGKSAEQRDRTRAFGAAYEPDGGMREMKLLNEWVRYSLLANVLLLACLVGISYDNRDKALF